MPSTTEGTISSRSALADPEDATTHGLFAQDVVQPALGEAPADFRRLTDEFTAYLQPRSPLERHYAEKIAAASWRLRRLHRWQAHIFEDETLTEDERMSKLDKVLRHETNLHRQIDTSVKMLNKDLPQLDRNHAHAAPTPNGESEPTARNAAAPPGGRPSSERDSSPRASTSRSGDDARICQNEPAPAPSDSPRIGGRGVIHSDSPSLTGRGGEPQASRGGSGRRGASLTLTAKGRLVPDRTDAARRLLFSA